MFQSGGYQVYRCFLKAAEKEMSDNNAAECILFLRVMVTLNF